MDPLTQGFVGATATQLVSPRKQKLSAAGIGIASGMAADLDVFIRSPVDPLLFLEYHRHFTHALVFIPFAALLCAFAHRLIFRNSRLAFSSVYLYCLVGYATHAVLDACTSYGTQLLWPMSDARIAWDIVSVIDPLFTLPIMLLIILAVAKKNTRLGFLAALYGFMYLGLGAIQNERASLIAYKLAGERGHTPINLSVKPSFGNIVVWKSIYEYNDSYYVDAIRIALDDKIYKGTVVAKVSLDEHFPWLEKRSQQALDIERFRWFSNDYLGLDPNNPNRIIDIRYSLIANQVTGMWGIVLDPQAGPKEHVEWTTNRPRGAQAMIKIREHWQFVKGQ